MLCPPASQPSPDAVHAARRAEALAINQGVTTAGGQHARQAVDGRRLARPVGPQQAEQAVALDRKPAALDGPKLAAEGAAPARAAAVVTTAAAAAASAAEQTAEGAARVEHGQGEQRVGGG